MSTKILEELMNNSEARDSQSIKDLAAEDAAQMLSAWG
jgi:hypothetical protein